MSRQDFERCPRGAASAGGRAASGRLRGAEPLRYCARDTPLFAYWYDLADQHFTGSYTT